MNWFKILVVALFSLVACGCQLTVGTGSGYWVGGSSGPAVSVSNYLGEGCYAIIDLNGIPIIDRDPRVPDRLMRLEYFQTRRIDLGWWTCGQSVTLQAKVFEVGTDRPLGFAEYRVYVPNRSYYYNYYSYSNRTEVTPWKITKFTRTGPDEPRRVLPKK